LIFVSFEDCDPEKIRGLAEFARSRGPVEGVKIIARYGTPVGKGRHHIGG